MIYFIIKIIYYIINIKISYKQIYIYNYISLIYIISFILSIFITIIYGNTFISWIYKKNIKENIRNLGLSGQYEKKGIPSMGGIIIIIPTLISVIILSRLDNIYTITLIFSTLWLSLIGFIDDYIKIFKNNKKGLNPSLKIFGQTILGLFISNIMYFNTNITIREKINFFKKINTFNIKNYNLFFYPEKHIINTTMPFIKNKEFYYYYITKFFNLNFFPFVYIIYILLITFIIISVSNGANITDGIDGLTAGISIIIVSTIVILSLISSNFIYSNYLNLFYIPNSSEIVIFSLSLLGSLIGFIWYNSYPAQIFMGDIGSLTIGGLIAILSILIRKEFLIPILCGLFFIENLSVLIQICYFKYSKYKYGIGIRLFNMAPIHHHFQKKGYHENKIVTRFLIIQFLLSITAIIIINL